MMLYKVPVVGKEIIDIYANIVKIKDIVNDQHTPQQKKTMALKRSILSLSTSATSLGLLAYAGSELAEQSKNIDTLSQLANVETAFTLGVVTVGSFLVKISKSKSLSRALEIKRETELGLMFKLRGTVRGVAGMAYYDYEDAESDAMQYFHGNNLWYSPNLQFLIGYNQISSNFLNFDSDSKGKSLLFNVIKELKLFFINARDYMGGKLFSLFSSEELKVAKYFIKTPLLVILGQKTLDHIVFSASVSKSNQDKKKELISKVDEVYKKYSNKEVYKNIGEENLSKSDIKKAVESDVNEAIDRAYVSSLACTIKNNFAMLLNEVIINVSESNGSLSDDTRIKTLPVFEDTANLYKLTGEKKYKALSEMALAVCEIIKNDGKFSYDEDWKLYSRSEKLKLINSVMDNIYEREDQPKIKNVISFGDELMLSIKNIIKIKSIRYKRVESEKKFLNREITKEEYDKNKEKFDIRMNSLLSSTDRMYKHKIKKSKIELDDIKENIYRRAIARDFLYNKQSKESSGNISADDSLKISSIIRNINENKVKPDKSEAKVLKISLFKLVGRINLEDSSKTAKIELVNNIFKLASQNIKSERSIDAVSDIGAPLEGSARKKIDISHRLRKNIGFGV